MSTLRQRITIMQWLSGILLALVIAIVGLYGSKAIELTPNTSIDQVDIAGTYG